MSLPGARLRWARRFALWLLPVVLCKERKIGVLSDEIEKVRTCQLDESWAKENIVVDIRKTS